MSPSGLFFIRDVRLALAATWRDVVGL